MLTKVKMQKTIRGQKILQLCKELHMSEAIDLQSQHTTAKKNKRQNKDNAHSLNMSEKINSYYNDITKIVHSYTEKARHLQN